MAPKDCGGEKNYGTMDSQPKEGVRVQRSITLLNGVALMIGSVIGSGIFITPKGVFSMAGSLGAGIVVWVVSGLFSMLGCFCFMELGTSIGRSGGEYAYLLEAFGPLAAFLHLWINMIVRQPSVLAIVSLTCAQYVFKPFFPECEPPVSALRLFAAATLCMMTYLNCTSVRWVMRIQGIFTAAKLVALLGIILAGLIHFGQGHTENFSKMFQGETRADTLALAFYSGLFSYIGWHFLNMITEEMVDPARNLPRAGTIAMVIVTIVYVLVNLAYIAVLPSEEILSSPAIAVSFGNEIFGWFTWTVPIAVAVSTIGSMNGVLFTSSRVVLVGAQDRLLPSFLAMLDTKECNPTPAIIVTGALALLMLTLSDVYALISYLSFSLWLTFGGCVAAMLWLRRTKPHLPRPLKMPLIIPITFLLGCAALLILPIMADPWNTGIGAAIIFTGFPAYWMAKYNQNNPKKIKIDWINIQIQKLLLVVPSDPHNNTTAATISK